MTDEAAALRKALERERARRNLAEQLLEEKSRALYASYKELEDAHLELTRNKESLIQSEKMASLGIMSAGMAHEINNPVGFMLSNMESLHEYLPVFMRGYSLLREVVGEIDQDSPLAHRRAEVLEYLQTSDVEYLVEDTADLLRETRDGLHRVKEIVAGLRMFSRADVGGMAELDVNACIEQTLQLARTEIRKTCDIIAELADDLPVVKGNQARLGQVLVNLLVNAVDAVNDASPEGTDGGSVTVRSRLLDGFVEIQVQDTGCGMDEALQKKIFEPFYTTKEVGRGTGLGLSISHGIIEEHGGRIRVDSTPGQGTTFSIELPVPSA